MQAVNEPVVVQEVPKMTNQTAEEVRRSAAVKVVMALAAIQVLFGALSVIIGIPLTILTNIYTLVMGFPIYCGVWIIVTGSIGIMVAKHPTQKSLIWAYVAFSIASCIVSLIDFILYTIAVSLVKDGIILKRCSSNSPNTCGYTIVRNWELALAFYSILLVLMIIEFIIALMASIQCCRAVCHSCSQSRSADTVQEPQPETNRVSHVRATFLPAGTQPGTQAQLSSQSTPGVNVQGHQPLTNRVPYVRATFLPADSQSCASTQPKVTLYFNKPAQPQQPHIATSTGPAGAQAQTQVFYTNAGMDKTSQVELCGPAEPPPPYS